MRKNIKKFIQLDWLLILGWFLWLGAYAHELGAEQKMREIVFVCGQRKWDNRAFEKSGHFNDHAPAPWQPYYNPFLLLKSYFLPPSSYG